MPAGSVAAPSIIPLRPPLPGQHKSIISSNIKIELWTETKDARIYYTINGTRPDPYQKFGDKCTFLYRAPFTLPAGKRTVKAFAIAGTEGERQSPVVTKTFEVQYSPPPEVPPYDDDREFQQDLEREKSKMELERATADLLNATKTAWADRAQEDIADAKFRESSRRALEEARKYERRHPGMYNHNAFMELPHDQMVPPYGPIADHCLHEEYTTDAIRALQSMNLKNKQDFLNFSTTTAGHQTSINEWMPTAYPPQSVHAVPSLYPPHHRPDIDIPLNMLPPSIPPSHVPQRVETKSIGSQTVGPFFPSHRRIEQLEKEVEEKQMMERQMERRPLLTAFSPGKGYWRKQVEHIYQHLKAHAQNDAEFRALIGEPKMGKMISSSVRGDGNEFTLMMTFTVRDSKGLFSGSRMGASTHNGYRGHSTARHNVYRGSDDEIMSEDNYTTRSAASLRSRRRPMRRPKPKKKAVSKVSSLDARLLRQLGSEGEGSSSEVQHLIDEGADPDCINKTGLPALHLAARYQHIDCIYVLCGAGADISAKGPSSRKGNTALHEAVSLGASGLRTVDALLRCGADQNIKNDRGETAYEMATKSGYDNIAKRFAAALGQTQLQKMIKPHSSVE
ncbi:double zinc ribbon and ankyrin repeat-containing protein 1-like [Babylonia areolata]|uniref:double zinc ribbon and ankyrin repeat-containing protein 1-like n=1 Tax=Babylonia areolata TaxID=304850 RepID=UPI003FD41A71